MGTFRLRITGVSLAVSDDWEKDGPVAVVLPNLAALLPIKEAPPDPIEQDVLGRDSSDCPHLGFLRWPSKGPEPAYSDAFVKHMAYLNRQRLTFRFRFKGEQRPPWSIQRDAKDGLKHTSKWGSYDYSNLVDWGAEESVGNALDLSAIVGRYVESDNLEKVPPPTVIAQVLLGKYGRFSCEEPGNNLRWELHSTNEKVGATKPITEAFIWEVPGVKKVEIVVEDLDQKKKARILSLGKLKRNGQLEVTLANLCYDNPLEWNVSRAVGTDEDVLWSLALFENNKAKTLQKEMKRNGKTLRDLAPRPKLPKKMGTGTGTGTSNCNPPRGLAKASAVKDLWAISCK